MAVTYRAQARCPTEPGLQAGWYPAAQAPDV